MIVRKGKEKTIIEYVQGSIYLFKVATKILKQAVKFT